MNATLICLRAVLWIIDRVHQATKEAGLLLESWRTRLRRRQELREVKRKDP